MFTIRHFKDSIVLDKCQIAAAKNDALVGCYNNPNFSFLILEDHH